MDARTVRITVNPVLDIETGALIAHDGQYEYAGPLALCNRAAQAQSQRAADTAAQTGSTLYGEGQAERAQLYPFLTRRLTAQHALTPTQTNELLTYAGAGTGGATGAFEGEAALNAARTRNTAGYQSALNRAALGRQQALGKASEGIGQQDVNLTEKYRQDAARGLGSLYGEDTGDALKAMGINAEDIRNEIESGRSGWFQNMTSFLNSIRGAGGKSFTL